MGNEYNHFQQHHLYYHNHHHANLQMQHKGTYLPILCSRPSIKDVQVPTKASSISNDPVSPRISCMGQVKRNNRVSGFPIASLSSHQNSSNNIHSNIKYSKLKKLFSNKYIIAISPRTAATAATATATRSRRSQVSNVNSFPGGRRRMSHDRHSENEKQSNCAEINLVELDPPLPVIKRAPKSPQEGDQEESLWKRRSGGAALKGLQLKPINLPRHQNQPITV